MSEHKRRFDKDGNQEFSLTKARADVETDVEFDSDIYFENENENENENDLKNKNRNLNVAKIIKSGNSYVRVNTGLDDEDDTDVGGIEDEADNHRCRKKKKKCH